MKLPLQNICSIDNNVYLFLRNPETKKLEVKVDKNFKPYYYQESPHGDYRTYKNTKAHKINKKIPYRQRNKPGVYETDVQVRKKYILEKDIEITPSPLKYMFFDIEVLSSTGSIKNGSAVISCITTKDNYTNQATQFYLGDYLENEDYKKAEEQLLVDFINHIKNVKPDMLLAWHIEFDWNYLCHRLPNIGKLISPIGKSRYWKRDSGEAPAGINIIDYLTLFKKVHLREASYKLDSVCEKYLGGGKVHKEMDFDHLSPELKERNLEDVELMCQLEDKLQLLPYYDEIRRLCKINWEELYYNSKAIEMLCLQEAKKMKIALPNKNKNNKKVQFQGAIRGIDEPGVFHNIGKYDLSGAYPAAIINFCLDEMNLANKNDRDAINIDGTWFKQNPNTLIPTVAKKMIALKQNVGDKKAKMSESDPEFNNIKNQYMGIKGVVNSTFGVLGNQFFRLYNDKIVSAITFLVRDLLSYVQNELKKQGYKIIYHDTDSIFIEHPDNVVDLLNDLIQEWGRLKYNKDQVNLKFEFEGHFKDLLILGTCHYYGVKTKKDSKPEVKGIEMKRCLDPLSIIPCLEGYKRLDDIEIGDLVYNGNGQLTEVLNKWESNHDTVYNIETINGRKLRCSANHIIFKYAKFKEYETTASDLKVGDYLLEPLQINKPNKTKVEKNLALFLGYVLSKGHYIDRKKSAKITLTFHIKEGNLVNHSRELMKKVFGNDVHITDSIRTETNTHSITCSGNKVKLLNKYLIKGYNKTSSSNSHKIPNTILGGSKEIVGQFLKTLFTGDGHINKNYICYNTVSKELFLGVQFLLKRLGIKYSVNHQEANKYNNNNRPSDSYCIRIARNQFESYYQLIDFEGEKSITLQNILLTKYKNVNNQYQHIFNNCILRKIKNITIEKGTFRLIDIETSDGNFLCDYLKVHNSSSTKYEAWFQEELIKKVLDNTTRDDIDEWIEDCKIEIKTLAMNKFCFPAKVAIDKVYKNIPIFVRAVENSKLFQKDFTVKPGERFYYVYIEKQGKDNNGKWIDVVAFKDNQDKIAKQFHDKVDWDKIIERNIDKKVEKIFEALKWTEKDKSGLLKNIKKKNNNKEKVPQHKITENEIKTYRNEKQDLLDELF